MAKDVTPEKMRRRATVRLLQKVQHAVPGVVLIQEGIHGLRDGAEGWHRLLAVSEIVVCIAVFVSLAGALRDHAKHIRAKTAPHVHTGIDWIDVFLGAMLFTEAWAKYVERGHLPRPTIALGIVMLFLGIFGGKFIAWKNR